MLHEWAGCEEEVAHQFAIKQQELFIGVPPWQLVEAMASFSEISQFSADFEQTACFLMDQILQQSRKKYRARTIERIIILAAESRKLNNFNMVAVCVAALKSPLVNEERLQRSWKKVGKPAMEAFHALVQFVSSDSLQRVQLEVAASGLVPCVPHIGHIRKAVASSHIEPSDEHKELGPGEIPKRFWDQMRVRYDAVKPLDKCISPRYNFEHSHYLQQHIQNTKLQAFDFGCELLLSLRSFDAKERESTGNRSLTARSCPFRRSSIDRGDQSADTAGNPKSISIHAMHNLLPKTNFAIEHDAKRKVILELAEPRDRIVMVMEWLICEGWGGKGWLDEIHCAFYMKAAEGSDIRTLLRFVTTQTQQGVHNILAELITYRKQMDTNSDDNVWIVSSYIWQQILGPIRGRITQMATREKSADDLRFQHVKKQLSASSVTDWMRLCEVPDELVDPSGNFFVRPLVFLDTIEAVHCPVQKLEIMCKCKRSIYELSVGGTALSQHPSAHDIAQKIFVFILLSSTMKCPQALALIFEAFFTSSSENQATLNEDGLWCIRNLQNALDYVDSVLVSACAASE